MEIHEQHQPYQLPLSPLGFTRGTIVSKSWVFCMLVWQLGGCLRDPLSTHFQSTLLRAVPRYPMFPLKSMAIFFFSQIWHGETSNCCKCQNVTITETVLGIIISS